MTDVIANVTGVAVVLGAIWLVGALFARPRPKDLEDPGATLDRIQGLVKGMLDQLDNDQEIKK